MFLTIVSLHLRCAEIATNREEWRTIVSKFVSDKEQRSVAVVLSFLALALALTILILSYEVVGNEQFIKEEPLFATKNDDKHNVTVACVPCIKLLNDRAGAVSDDPLLRKLTIEVKDGKEICCAKNAEQMATLFESVARVNELSDQPLPSFNATDFRFSPVSAHKRLYPARILKTFGIPEIPELPPLCEFKEDDPRWGVEHHRGVDILKTGLGIRHGGLYYIYASILFRPQSLHPCREFQYQIFTAHVEKVSSRASTSEIILKTTHTCCDTCINTQDVRFISGIFILQPGDVIRVKVMSYELVHFHPITTYVGLSMFGLEANDESSE